MDPFRPEQWHDFFLMVGGGAAALTGLVVVAMSLHLDVIAADPVLRYRARSILTGLAAAGAGRRSAFHDRLKPLVVAPARRVAGQVDAADPARLVKPRARPVFSSLCKSLLDSKRSPR